MATIKRAEMTSASINDLPDSAFAYIEGGGKKDAVGKTAPRSLRHFPIQDAAHVRNALARAPQSPFGDKAMPAIKAAAKKFGVEVSDSSAQRSEEFESVFFMRSYPLEDIHIQRSGDGRTVEAYAAVFDTAAEIKDHEGHYFEVIDPKAFNKVVNDVRPQGARRGWAVGVFYNHALTLHGTPSDRGAVPIGTPIDIRPDSRGLLTVTRYNRNALADEVLEAIRDGGISGQSFTGRIVRSLPSLSGYQRRAGGHQPDKDGRLVTVRRMELGLSEYGPTPMPAYKEAGILTVRSLTQAQQDWTEDTPSHSGAVADDTKRRLEDITRRKREAGITT